MKNIEKVFHFIYKEKSNLDFLGCLFLPLLKILLKENDWVSREEIISKLSKYGDFSRGNLSFDHLFSHQFRKGKFQDFLNTYIEYDATPWEDGSTRGAIKNKYKIREEQKESIDNFFEKFQVSEEQIQEQIIGRINYLTLGKARELKNKYKNLITQYKNHLKKEGNNEEVYKWELVKKFQNITSQSNFFDNIFVNIKKLDFDNLISWRKNIYKNPERFLQDEKQLQKKFRIII